MRKKAGIRFLSLLMTLVLALSLLPAAALAAETEETAEDAATTEETYPWAGSGTADDPYLLADADDFDQLDALVTDGNAFAGIYFLVTADITLSEGWDGIGYSEVVEEESWGYIVPTVMEFKPFSGVFDGGGYTLTFPAGSQPLFDCVSGTTIQNLSIYSDYIADDGLIANYTVDSSYSATASITNVTILSGTKLAGSGFLGGYASGSNTVTIDSCAIESGVIIGCDENGASNGSSNIGGFGGDFNGTISNSTCAATVYGVDFVGGIVGGQGQSMSETAVVNCSFTGSVIATGSYVGGIAGCGYTGTGWGFSSNAACISIQNCYVSGSVTGGDYVGGILGAEPAVTQCWANGVGTVTDNVFYGVLSCDGDYVGGVIGYMMSLDRYNVIANNYYLDTAAASGIGYVDSVDTSDSYGREDDPTGADADSLVCGKTAAEMADGTVVELLNGSATSRQNWVQSKDGPVFDGEAVTPVSLTVSGDYQTRYAPGDDLDLSGASFTLTWSDGSVSTLTLDDLTISGYDPDILGEQTVTLTYRTLSATITVTVAEESTIAVTFSLLGDSVHGSDGETHTLVDGNLETWIDAVTYTVSADATAYDVFELALTQAGIAWTTATAYGSFYVDSVNGLAELDNGERSGWMFTLNGEYGWYGISQQYLEDGDVIVFHYTDDYMVEYGYSDSDNSGDSAVSGSVTDEETEDIYLTTGAYLATTVTDPTVSSVGGDWSVLGLARAGYAVSEDFYATYYQNVVELLEANDGVLSSRKYTEYARVILALTAAGYDPTDVAGYNLLEKLADYDAVIYQGINGAIYALLAFDCGEYEIPTVTGVTQATRESLIAYILDRELDGGGWAISGDTADVDVTAMAVQALAPYYETNAAVQAAIDRALAVLSELQSENGGYTSSESCAQVIVALTALGIDPDTDERFIQNGVSVLDALCAYYVSGGGFAHTAGTDRDGMATEQGYYALAAYYRFKAGQTSLYDMTDVTPRTAPTTAADDGTTSTAAAAQTGDPALVALPVGLLLLSAWALALLRKKRTNA